MNKLPKEIKDRKIFYDRLKKMKKLGVHFKILDQEGEDFYIRYSYNNKKIYLTNSYFFEHLDKISSSFVGNKEFVKQALKRIKIKYPKGFIVNKFSEIKPLLKKYKMGFPLVLKPVKSGGGKGVTANINNQDTLRKAFSLIVNLYKEKNRKMPPVIVEEFFSGREFRLLILKGKFIACSERVRPSITGDGKGSVKELIDKHMRTEGWDIFSFDWEVTRNLKLQKVNLKTILPKGKVVVLRENTNMSTGGLSIIRTKEVCPKFKKIAEACAREFDVQLCGVDIMTSDISSPKSDYRVIEINHRPGFYTLHDAPDIGRPDRVTDQIIKAVFDIK